MSMRERIATGKLFTDNCEGLPEDRLKAKLRMIAFNASRPDEPEERIRLMSEIFGRETRAWIEPPFYFCYGTNIELGEGCYLNFNCSIVDDGKVVIGRKVMFGPAVTIATVGHPINPAYRGYMFADAVHIEDNCWIGAGAIICPGVTIGENSVVGAGSVVIRDIPANSIAVGNPCRVLRSINEHDKEYYNKDRPIRPDDLAEEARLRRGEQ
jgi:Acetyltransferase (isoleucine patch superfamily)